MTDPNQPMPPMSAKEAKAQAAATKAYSDSQRSWFARHKVLTGLGAVILIGAIGSAAGGSSDKKPTAATDQSQTGAASSTPSATSAPAPAPASAAPSLPAALLAFDAVVQKGRDDYESTDNELKQREFQTARNRGLCKALPGGDIVNWRGQISSLDTNGGGNAVLELHVGQATKVTTWNNSFSDTEDHTLIPQASAMYKTLVNLSEGDDVIFSGHLFSDSESCFKEISLTLNGQMTTPNFLIRFTDIRKAP